MTHMSRTWPLAPVLLAAAAALAAPGCGKSEPPAPTPAAAPAAPTPPVQAPTPAAAPAPTAPAKPTPPVATAAQRKTYRVELARGRALAKAGKWGEAVKAFEACLGALPGDARATGELGWALFNAGDHARAKVASTDAVKQAMDPEVKAASLYNLGRVEEASGDVAGAARRYAESLALRPNKAVSARLAKLGVATPTTQPNDTPPCAAPQKLDAVCGCLTAAALAADPEARTGDCTVDDELVPGVRIVRAGMSFSEVYVFVLAGAGDTWSVVTPLEYIYNPGAFGIFEELGRVSAAERTVAGRRVVQITWEKTRSDRDLGVNQIESEDTTNVAFCVRGQDGAAALTCPLVVQTLRHAARETFMDDPESVRMAADLDPALIPATFDVETRVDATLGDDGVVSVVLGKGVATPQVKAQLGPHKLF